MQIFFPTIVLRHRKENLKKCSLSGLEERSDFAFLTYPLDLDSFPNLSSYVVLDLSGAELTKEDGNHGLFLIDATWRYAKKIRDNIALPSKALLRSIPSSFRTAYPRKQEDCSDQERGLASIEAVYIAYRIMGKDVKGLLEGYYWKEKFLEKNRGVW